MHAWVVVVVVVLVVSVLIATALLLRSVVFSPRKEYRRNLRDIRQIREDVRAEASNDATIRVNRDDWAGTTDLPG